MEKLYEAPIADKVNEIIQWINSQDEKRDQELSDYLERETRLEERLQNIEQRLSNLEGGQSLCD